MSDVWSSEKLDGEMTRFGIRGVEFAEVLGWGKNGEAMLSSWRTGRRKPSRRKAQKAQFALQVANELTAKSGIPPNFNDVRWFREQVRKAGGGHPPKPIDQSLGGSAYLSEFCLHVRIAPEEVCYLVTLKPKVARAEIVSLPCQRWIRAWTMAFAHELGGKLFDEFAAAFPTRDAALATLQRGAYKRLLDEIGASKIREYLHAMILTGELESAPHDADEN